MNGPAHYVEAEKLLAHAAQHGDADRTSETAWLAAAQVHATLAQAAATANLAAITRRSYSDEVPALDDRWRITQQVAG